MSPVLILLVSGLIAWTLLCAWCGIRSRFLLFGALLLLGLFLIGFWMMAALQAAPFSGPALTTYFSLSLYGVGSFGTGWLIGRIWRQWREARATS